MATEYDKKNPRMGRDIDPPGTHSSTTESVAKAPNAQSDDDIQNVPPPQDPNLSGNAPTSTPYTWLAGKMDGWVENDCYRNYFEQGVGCDGMLATGSISTMDGDYDDNGGYPTAIGHSRGHHGPAHESEAELGREYSANSFPLGSVVVRRI